MGGETSIFVNIWKKGGFYDLLLVVEAFLLASTSSNLSFLSCISVDFTVIFSFSPFYRYTYPYLLAYRTI